jgi:hypothetical protein
MEMRQGFGFRVLAALLLLGFIAFITAGAYAAGFAAGGGSTVTNVQPWAYGGALGAGHVVGFVVTIIVLIVMFRLIGLLLFGHRRRAWAHHGYWGPQATGEPGATGPGEWHGGWHRSNWREVGQARFDEYHRRAHDAQPPTTPAAGGSPTDA